LRAGRITKARKYEITKTRKNENTKEAMGFGRVALGRSASSFVLSPFRAFVIAR
jgi:hypothetical protein